jgi:hypothetical protein
MIYSLTRVIFSLLSHSINKDSLLHRGDEKTVLISYLEGILFVKKTYIKKTQELKIGDVWRVHRP